MTRCSEFFQKRPFSWTTGASGRDSALRWQMSLQGYHARPTGCRCYTVGLLFK
jgi:hypothetical protein